MSGSQVIDWESRYQAGATGWERPGPHPAFVDWLDSGALAPCRILVPGAGRSPEPLALAESGFDVTMVDAAPSAVAAQRARLERLHLKATVHLADLFAWEPEQPFEAIYDQTCLCALAPELWPAYEQRLARWLVPGGSLFVLLMQTGQQGGPPFDCDLTQMRTLFAPERWAWPDTLAPVVAHPSLRNEQPAVLRRL